jgi:hypothetical protein
LSLESLHESIQCAGDADNFGNSFTLLSDSKVKGVLPNWFLIAWGQLFDFESRRTTIGSHGIILH